MSAIAFLFRRQAIYRIRFWLLITGYDVKRRELSERLYGVYALIILFGWLVVMLSAAVVGSTDQLVRLKLSPGELQVDLCLALAIWLSIVPWFAQRSHDLYRFSLPDLEFLSGAPFRPGQVAPSWFAKGLLTLPAGLLLLGCGILASALNRVRHDSDMLGLLAGVLSAASVLVVARAVTWALGLLRYYPRPRFAEPAGVLLSGLGIVLLLPLLAQALPPPSSTLLTSFSPLARLIFWPAWLASSLITGSGSAAWWSLPVQIGTAGLAVVALALVARRTLMAPAFEEGQTGGQRRRASEAGAPAVGARVQIHLARRPSSRRGRQGAPAGTVAAGAPASTASPAVQPYVHVERAPAAAAGGRGALSALIWKERLRLVRMPPEQALLRVLAPLLLGATVAPTIALLTQVAHRIEILAPATFFANYALLRWGAAPARSDLAHADLFVGWPISRSRMLLIGLLVGLLPVGLSGEVALLVAALTGIGQIDSALLWLIWWPALLAVSTLAACLELRRLLVKWPGTASTIPEIGPGPILLTGLVWLGAVFLLA